MVSDEFWMRLALKEGQRTGQNNEVPVGAVIVKEARLLSIAGNSPISSMDCTCHAEIQAIRQASAIMKNYRLSGCSLYVTLEPCLMCMGAILQARIQRLVYSLPEPKTGALSCFLKEGEITNRLQVTKGILTVQTKLLMEAFFRARR